MKSLSKTPAPPKDRIHGSKVNPKGSASSEQSASAIKLDAKTIASLSNKLSEFKETHKTNKVSLNDLKAVYRRGLGAYSSTHRPTISGGKPNTRNAWAMARVNAFLRKAGGGEHKKSYVQDDDLLKYEDGGMATNDAEKTGFLKFRENAKWIKRHPEALMLKEGGETDEHNETYKKWRSLVNMSYGELKKFYESEEGREAGLSSREANKQGISSGRESARWIMKMKQTPKSEWTPTMWKWANKQISFISRMSGNEGGLYDEKGNKTRKHTSLLIWGHNPKKGSSMKYAKGGATTKYKIYHETLSEALEEADKYVEANGYHFSEDSYFPDLSYGGIRYGETKRVSRELDGKRKNKLMVQIYRMDSGKYELNMYFAYEGGGQVGVKYYIGRPEVSSAGRFGKKMATWKTCVVDENGNKNYSQVTMTIFGSAKNLKLDGIRITQKEFDKLNFNSKMADGGQMDVRMEDTVQRMDDPNFADISLYRKGGKIDWTEFYMDGGMNKTCEKFDKNGERKIDMKSIDELTYCVNKLPQTKEFHFHDGKYDEDRKKLHKEIIYKIKKNLVCVESDKPIAIMMGGSPASGKSTFLKKYRPYLLENEILKVDADEIRSQLPEYKGFNATQTHLETKDIVNLLLSDRNIGIPCRFDLIYDGTMNNTKSYMPLIALLKSLGYKIFVVYIDKVPKDVIVHRALERYKKSGRFVPLEVIDDFFSKGKSALNEIKKEVDGYMIVDGSDSNYHVIEKGGMQLPRNRRYSKLGEPIKITTEDVVREYKRGGEINPDDSQLKNEVVHKSGKVGGMLVGKRHSEGGIKAYNKSTGQPLEMEGGEVVITRNAVSDNTKREFEGKMMTNKEILSKINESGGGVSFAKGGSVKAKDDCGCGGYGDGGSVKDMKHQYPKDFKKGVREETREHSDTFSDLKRNKISLKEAAEKVVAKHLSEKPNYYKNYKHGGYLTLGDKQIPSLDSFLKGEHMIKSPFDNDDSMYAIHEEAESHEHKFHRVDDKKAKPISNLLAYETYLYDSFGILFSQLPTQVQNALTLGKQALIDNYINS